MTGLCGWVTGGATPHPVVKNGAVQSVWAFIKLSRPHFLMGGVLMFALGAAAAGRFDPGGYALGQLMVTAAQVTAHYVNEYADLEPDRAITSRTLFSGGSGVLVGGLLPPSVALRAARVSTGVTVIAALALAFVSLPGALLGVVAVAISWSYSMPPLRLLGSGFGEVAASVVVAGLVPVIGALAQGGGLTATLGGAIATLFLIHLAMMLAFELPDLTADASTGKRVLAVRIGPARTRALIVLLLVGSVALMLGQGLSGAWSDGEWVAILAGLPSATLMIVAMIRRRPGLLTACAVATLVLVAMGLLYGSLR